MAQVAFLRGVNVGGHKTFQPSALAGELKHLGAVSVGAAGTFIIPGRCSGTTLRTEFASRLNFPAELIICRASDLRELVAGDRFGPPPAPGELRRFVSILKNKPRTRFELPLQVPASEPWQVKFVEVFGPFALAWWRRIGNRFIDPNSTAEKSFGVIATTRSWNTIVKLAAVLDRMDRPFRES